MPEKDQVVSFFARAITRDEFGRFYWDERRESEVRRSLASAMARVKKRSDVPELSFSPKQRNEHHLVCSLITLK